MGRHRYETLAITTDEEREAILRAGTPPDIQRLAGWEFRGWNTPAFASIAGIKKFKKGFFSDPKVGGAVRGYNKDIRQEGGLSGDWIEKGKKGSTSAKPFGFYDVLPQNGGSPYSNSVLLDYGCPRNARLDPTRLLRDYVVQVDPDNPDLLLGKAYLALPPKWPTVSWFILERLGPGTPPID